MSRIRPIAFLSLAGLALPLAAADSFTIDPSHTLPAFEVNHLGFSTQRGRFDRAAGRITLDPARQKGSVELTIEAASISMGQAKWDEHMKSPDFFDVARFPTITFKSDQIRFVEGKPVSARGELTLLGVTRPVQLDIRGFACGENPIAKRPLCAADVEARLKRSEFGMTRYLPAVGDDVRVLVPVEAFRDPAS